MPDWRITLSDIEFGLEEEEAALRVIRSKWLSMGSETQAFEGEFGSFTGSKHAIAVANGTAALHLALLGLDLRAGDEVIQPAINFVAAANMTIAVGARPMFADVTDLANPTIGTDGIRRCITPRSRAVIVMHHGGHVCDMGEIREVCKEHGLALIEDACHAVGARSLDLGQAVGTLGDVACFSFFSNKNLTTGEGGMVTTDDDDLADRIRLLRSHGMTTLSWQRHQGHASSYDVIANGFNYRFDEIRAAIGREQLRKLPDNNLLRHRLVERYRCHLSNIPGWIVPFMGRGEESAHHLMVAVAPNEAMRRSAVETLREAGIQSSLHYPCIADLAAFSGNGREELPVSREFARRAVTLPLFPSMTLERVDEVCIALGSVPANRTRNAGSF
jgi:dTDP-4-amino-4,6-dideoxygalactose transaminase